jgi:addiction module RelB/DinJ family antitoxin
MNENTTMSFKINKTLKSRAQQTAKSIGIPLSTLINAYLNDMVATGRVEFTASEKMTPQMERIIANVEAEIKKGETYGPFDNVEDMITSLHKESKNQKNAG